MAAGERKRKFRFLFWARIVAASVVALAFTATVVVVVLTAGLGPDNVRLTVTHGHIESAGLLWSTKDFLIEHLRKRRIENTTFYTPAKELTIWVSMNAHDPSRRATNVCVAAVHILDMPNAPSFDDMVDIATVNNTVTTGSVDRPCALWRHPGSASMQLDRWITLNDPLMLCYISQKYGGINDFTVMLKVEMKLTYPEEDKDHTEEETHYCWPVTIGNTRSIRSEAINCKPSHAIDYASNARALSVHDDFTPRQRWICNIEYLDSSLISS